MMTDNEGFSEADESDGFDLPDLEELDWEQEDDDDDFELPDLPELYAPVSQPPVKVAPKVTSTESITLEEEFDDLYKEFDLGEPDQDTVDALPEEITRIQEPAPVEDEPFDLDDFDDILANYEGNGEAEREGDDYVTDEDDYEDDYDYGDDEEDEEEDGDFGWEEVDDEEDEDENSAFLPSEDPPDPGMEIVPVSKKKKAPVQEPEPETPSDADTDEDSNDEDSNDQPEGTSVIEKLKAKFKDFKRQAAAELQGKDADDLESEGASENDEPPSDDENGEPSKAKKGARKVFGPFIKFYTKIVDAIFNFLIKIVSFLGKIPLLGKVFLAIKANAKILRWIARLFIPILVVWFIFNMNANAVPKETTTELPDFGKVTMTDFSYDAEKNIAKGVIKNDGEVIAEVTPTFTVYSRQVSINPLKWITPKPKIECVGSFTKVGIDEQEEVIAKCKEEPDGIMFKVSGSAK